jgi:hypothetical protein
MTMRWAGIVPLWIAGTCLAIPSPVQAQTADSQLPVSIARIRAGLERPPSLLESSPRSAANPTFRIEVRAHPTVLRPIDDEPFDPTMGLPSAGELLMDGIEKIGSAVSHSRHRRADRRARQEVDDALAAFCAANACHLPDTGK